MSDSLAPRAYVRLPPKYCAYCRTVGSPTLRPFISAQKTTPKQDHNCSCGLGALSCACISHGDAPGSAHFQPPRGLLSPWLVSGPVGVVIREGQAFDRHPPTVVRDDNRCLAGGGRLKANCDTTLRDLAPGLAGDGVRAEAGQARVLEQLDYAVPAVVLYQARQLLASYRG